MNPSDESDDLIIDLKRFAKKLGKTPTKDEMNEYGPHYAKLYQNKFGSWNGALEAAGLEPNLVHNISRKDVMEDIERVAEALEKTPTLNDMDKFGKYSKLTYQRKLASFIDALEELNLEPTQSQYNFSNRDAPPGLRATENVRWLEENGPTPASDLPNRSVSDSDKRHGLAGFVIKSGQTGQAQSERVYYLFDEHDPVDVVRTFLEVNPQVLENRTHKAITEDIGEYGKKWSMAADEVLDG